MSNKIKDIDTNNHTYHFFDDIIDVKCCNPNKIKIDEKSNKNIQITTLDIWLSKIWNT